MKKEIDYYDLLGVSIFASQEEIKAAYIAKIKQYHPDTYNGNKTEAENITPSLNEGYSVLYDAKQKEVYDQKYGFDLERQKILRQRQKQQKKNKQKFEKNYTEEKKREETAKNQKEFNEQTQKKDKKIRTNWFTKRVKKGAKVVDPFASDPEKAQARRERLILDITIIALLVILIVVLIFK